MHPAFSLRFISGVLALDLIEKLDLLREPSWRQREVIKLPNKERHFLDRHVMSMVTKPSRNCSSQFFCEIVGRF